MRKALAAGGLVLLVLLLSYGGPGGGSSHAEASLVEAAARLPLAFQPNRGQAVEGARYLARGSGYSILVRPGGAELRLRGGEAVRLDLLGGNLRAALAASRRLPGTVNYFLGNDRSRWLTGIPTFGRVTATDVYRGIDVAYHGHGGALEYDFVIRPDADPSRISLAFRGVRDIRLDRSGLMLHVRGGTLRQRAPFAYQQIDGVRRAVESRFVLEGRRVRFALGAYDRSRTLVIDPSLAYSTYLGGTAADFGNGIAVDSAGSAYVTGDTLSTDFPTTPGAHRPGYGGFGTEVFVTKLDVAGSALVYSTYLGGTSSETGYGIAVDSAGAAYVTGDVLSTDFPTSVGAFQGTRAVVGPDAFVTKLTPAGDDLVYSTYLGGDDNDTASAIAVEGGSAYVAGMTHSTDFPTASPYQPAPGPGGPNDAFVTKLSADGTALDYSTYLGGTGSDYATGIAVVAGLAHVTGTTFSTDFPAVSAFQGTKSGTSDAFVTKLNAAGSAPLYSTYLGGSDLEYGYAVAADSGGSAYVTGQTGSTDFPTTVGAYQTTADTLSGAFVTKLNPTGSAQSYSTYLGGSLQDAGTGIAVDSAGTAYVLGATFSTDFPTANPHQASNGGDQDLFITMLTPIGDDLTYSTYLGGGGAEYGNGIAVASVGYAYVTGRTASGNFPTTAGAFQETSGGDDDAFVAKLGPGAPTAVALRSFVAARTRDGVVLRWRTATESSLLGFDVFRERMGLRVRLNAALIRAAGDAGGRAYSFGDHEGGRRYWLRGVRSDGSRVWLGTAVATGGPRAA